MNYTAIEEQQMELAKVEEKKKCLARKDQVDICENLILVCQTPYSREEIKVATQTAAERLES